MTTVWDTGDMASAEGASELIRRATSGLRDPRTWRAAGFIAVSFPTTLLLFIAALTLLTPALVLCVVGVGFWLSLGALGALRWLGGFERRRVAWIGTAVPAPRLEAGSTITRFRDADRWRVATFALSAWFISTMGFVALGVVWGVPLYLLSVPIWGWAIDSFSVVEILAMGLVGSGALLIAPAPTQWIARVLGRFVDDRLGPDRLELMQRQVSEVTESRTEILNAVAGERRRIERNLHDGVQQQLVALGIDLGLAEAKLATDPEAAKALLADATRKTRESISELRAIGRGLHPAILGDRGLDAALSAAVSNSSVPVELRSALDDDPPVAIAEAAYFVVSEALTNVMKHSKASTAVVDVATFAGGLHVSVYDDGLGGAAPTGTGLAGIAARVRGLNGTFEVVSPSGGPTTISVVLPYP